MLIFNNLSDFQIVAFFNFLSYIAEKIEKCNYLEIQRISLSNIKNEERVQPGCYFGGLL